VHGLFSKRRTEPAMQPHLGGTRALEILVTVDDQQGGDMVELTAPPVTIAIHYDDYTVFRSPLSHFLDEVRRRQLGGEMRTVARGEDGRAAFPGQLGVVSK
jgi:hypothetical protein